MKKLLVDSDFLVGVFRQGDTNHQKAIRLLEKMKEEDVELWMSNLVHQESATVVSHRVGMEAVRLFVKNLTSDIHKRVLVDEELEKKAWKIFLSQTKKGCSFVDCANVAVAEKYKLDGILSFDEFYPPNLRITSTKR